MRNLLLKRAAVLVRTYKLIYLATEEAHELKVPMPDEFEPDRFMAALKTLNIDDFEGIDYRKEGPVIHGYVLGPEDEAGEQAELIEFWEISPEDMSDEELINRVKSRNGSLLKRADDEIFDVSEKVQDVTILGVPCPVMADITFRDIDEEGAFYALYAGRIYVDLRPLFPGNKFCDALMILWDNAMTYGEGPVPTGFLYEPPHVEIYKSPTLPQDIVRFAKDVVETNLPLVTPKYIQEAFEWYANESWFEAPWSDEEQLTLHKIFKSLK